MKKFFLFLLILIVVVGGIGGVGAYLSYIVISENEIVYIQTKFRPKKKYEPGYEFFPEKLLFWDNSAFIMKKINFKKNDLEVKDIKIPLPSLTPLKKVEEELGLKTEDFTIQYNIKFTYQISEDYQSNFLFESDSNVEEFKTDLKEFITTRHKGIINKLLEKSLSEDKPIILTKIFEEANSIILSEIANKYSTEKRKDIIFDPEQEIYSIEKVINFDRYLELRKQSEKFQRELLEQQLAWEKKETKQKSVEQSIRDQEKSKIEAQIENLKLYGKLFKEYPEALNYLYLQKLADKVHIIMAPQDRKSLFAPLLPPNTKTPEELAKEMIEKEKKEEEKTKQNEKQKKEEVKKEPEIRQEQSNTQNRQGTNQNNKNENQPNQNTSESPAIQ